MELGAFSVSLAVKDIAASKLFMKNWALPPWAAIKRRAGLF